MSIEIRKLTDQELPAVLALLARWNMAPRLGDPSAERSEIIVENTFVAVQAGRIVGVASYILHSHGFAETASLAVDCKYLGQGVGYRLQQARLEEMRSRGVRRVRTEADRPETIRWYVEKFGYRIVGTNPKKHDFGRSDIDRWTVLELDWEHPARDREA